MTIVRNGIDVLLEKLPAEMKGARVGIVTNHTGATRDLRSTIDVLIEHPHVHVVSLFGPEHGVRGSAQAGETVGHQIDPQSGLPVHSLYGETRKPTVEMLADIDALLIDIQDAGVRFYTYQSTMLNCLEACAAHGTQFVVLDRPNPIDATRVEGGMLDMNFASFIGAQRTPARHGMTFGELACLFAEEHGLPRPLIVPVQGWSRSMWFDETDLPWVIPSPNLPTISAATLYPGTCIIEGTNYSEGRGTTLPFEQIGAPWIDPFELTNRMNALELPGFRFRPTFFTPTFSKHQGTQCGGVQIHVRDRDLACPIEMGVHLLWTLNEMSGDNLNWTSFRQDRFFIDNLTGDSRIREAWNGGESPDAVLSAWQRESEEFRDRRTRVLLYD